VRAATTLAFSSSALEAHVAAQLAPVPGIERSQLRPDWHGYAASFAVQRRIAARKDNALLNTVIRHWQNSGSRAGPQANHARGHWSGVGRGVDTRQGIRRPQGPSAGTQTINQKKEAIRL
jgi:hypothetical protein